MFTTARRLVPLIAAVGLLACTTGARPTAWFTSTKGNVWSVRPDGTAKVQPHQGRLLAPPDRPMTAPSPRSRNSVLLGRRLA